MADPQPWNPSRYFASGSFRVVAYDEDPEVALSVVRERSAALLELFRPVVARRLSIPSQRERPVQTRSYWTVNPNTGEDDNA